MPAPSTRARPDRAADLKEFPVKDIAGKTVVVTGASSGIGREIAVAFGRHGARVVVHYRSDAAGAHEVADLVNDGGGTAQIFGADLSVAAECQAFADEVLDAVERVDVVVNSVGGFVRRVPLADADDHIIDAVFDLNARSTVAWWPRSARRMVVATSSTSPLRPLDPGRAQVRASTPQPRATCRPTLGRSPKSLLPRVFGSMRSHPASSTSRSTTVRPPPRC